jgi:hypothetical protein
VSTTRTVGSTVEMPSSTRATDTPAALDRYRVGGCEVRSRATQSVCSSIACSAAGTEGERWKTRLPCATRSSASTVGWWRVGSPTSATWMRCGMGSPSASEYAVTNSEPMTIATTRMTTTRSGGDQRCSRRRDSRGIRGAVRRVALTATACSHPRM